MPANATNVTVQKITIAANVIMFGKRQLTLRIWDQLKHRFPMDENGKLIHDHIWGYAHRCCKNDICNQGPSLGEQKDHIHFAWSKGNELFRGTIYHNITHMKDTIKFLTTNNMGAASRLFSKYFINQHLRNETQFPTPEDIADGKYLKFKFEDYNFYASIDNNVWGDCSLISKYYNLDNLTMEHNKSNISKFVENEKIGISDIEYATTKKKLTDMLNKIKQFKINYESLLNEVKSSEQLFIAG